MPYLRTIRAGRTEPTWGRRRRRHACRLRREAVYQSRDTDEHKGDTGPHVRATTCVCVATARRLGLMGDELGQMIEELLERQVNDDGEQ